jgi:hypothetical protein
MISTLKDAAAEKEFACIATDFLCTHGLFCVPKLLQSFIMIPYFYTFGWRLLTGKFVTKYWMSL